MSSWSRPNLGLGCSDAATPPLSERSSAPWASSSIRALEKKEAPSSIKAPVFQVVSDWQKGRRQASSVSPPRFTPRLRTASPLTSLTVVDKEQSEVVHQQWRLLREQIADITGGAIVMHSEIKEMRRSADQEQAERRADIEAVQVALRSSEDRIFRILEEKLEDIRLSMEAHTKTVSHDNTSLLEKSMSQAEALTHALNQDLRKLLAEEATARSSNILELDEKFIQLRPVLAEVASKADFDVLKTGLVRLTADLEREVAARAEGDKYTRNQQLQEMNLRERTDDLHKQLEQEVKTRLAGDDQMRHFLRDSLAKAGHELEAKILQMAQSMLEDKMGSSARRDQESMKKLQDSLETVARERSELACMVESTHEKLKTQISIVESGVSSNHSNFQACVADLTAQVESLRSTVQDGIALEEKLLQSCTAHERMQVQLSQVESGANLTKAIVAELIAKVENQTSSVQEKLEQLYKAHENLNVQISKVESGGSSNHSSIKAIVEDLTAKVEALAATVHAGSSIQLAVEEKLEQSCKALGAHLEQALDKVRVGLKLEMTELRGKRDELDKAMREAHSKLQIEMKEHKQSTEKERSLLQKDFQEEKRARDAAHNNLDTELKNRDRAHKDLDGKMEDLEKRFKSTLNQLSAKQQTHADSMNSTERRLRDEIVKMNQGAALKQMEVERKWQEEFTSVHSRLGQRIADLSKGLDDKGQQDVECLREMGQRVGSLREMVTKVSKDVEALSSSVQEEVRLRTAAEIRLSSRCSGLRAELSEVAKEQHASLRREVEDQRENLKTYLTSQKGWDSETLTVAVQRLEGSMQKLQTLSTEVTQLKLDQTLAQGNLDRRLQDLDSLSCSLQQLQADYDTLRRSMSWEDEMRRVWEALDTHTHSVPSVKATARAGKTSRHSSPVRGPF